MTIKELITSALLMTGRFAADDEYPAELERGHATLKTWVHSVKWLYDLYASSNNITIKEIGELGLNDEFPYDTSFASMASMFLCTVLCPEVIRYKEIYEDMSKQVRILCASDVAATVSRYP
ncbi:MAG: hypothetical protein IIX75_02030 [Clostridia bacterium]|nr:hypothetical protein [Clostridia bacterium]